MEKWIMENGKWKIKKIGTGEIVFVAMEKTQKDGKTFCEEEEERRE